MKVRVTQNSLTRSYMRNLNRNLSDLAKSNERMTTQRRFNRVSENTSDAARAYTIRDQLARNEEYLTNIRDAKGELSSAESNMMAMSDILKNVQERVVKGINGTTSPDQREILAKDIDNLREELLQLANAKFGDKYLFSGSSNDTSPFTVVNGELLFNGVNVDATNDRTLFQENSDVYIDIGLGLTLTGGSVDTKSAFKVSTSGIDVLGFGTSTVDGKTMPNNLYNLLGTIADELRSGDTAAAGKSLEHLKTKTTDMLINITDIGNRDNFLEHNINRIESDQLGLMEAQKKLEGISLEEESIYNKSYEMAWMVTLQLGSKIIPPSIFDFMR